MPLKSPGPRLTALAGLAGAALDMFCALLGSFSGNVALMFGARGGSFYCRGDRAADRRAHGALAIPPAFEEKGRLRPYLEAIPSNVIVHSGAAFVGLKSLATGSIACAKGR
jgi:glucokinase